MKYSARGVITGGLLFWPMLAFADDQEVKYTLLFVGGIGGILVGASLYALLMILAAGFLRRRALLAATWLLSSGIFIFAQYTSFQTLRVAIGLWRSQKPTAEPAGFTIWLKLALVLVVLFALAVTRFAYRLWKKRRRLRGPNEASRISARHMK